MKKLFIGLAAVFISDLATAQQNLTGNNLDSVIVHENRLQAAYGRQNRNIQILDNKQISTLPVKSVNELLTYVAGIDMRQRGPWGSQSDVSIDGSTFDEVLVLVNGVKVSDPQTGHNMMNLPIPVSAIDHIEILRGPAARIYGVNALAGAINIVTRIPQQNEVSAQVYAGSNFEKDTSNNDTYYGWGAQASATLAGKNQSNTISFAHDQGNGYRYNTAFEANRLYYQNHIRVNDKGSIDAMGGYVSNTYGANGFYSAPGDKEAKETVQTAIAGVGYTYQLNKKIKLMPRVSYRYAKDDYIYIRQKPEVYHNIHETNVLTGELQSTIQLGDGVLGAGVEYRNEGINSNNLGKHDRNNLGVYAEYKYHFNTNLNASAGLYANYNSDYDWQVFPGVDVGYYFLPKWKFFAAGTTGQRLPTYTDLYYKGPTNIGNDQLKPELASYAEGGVQYKSTLLSGQASYFYRHITNFIDWVKASVNDPWQPQNFQSINTQGVTLQAQYELSKHLQMSDKCQLQLQAAYTYLNPAVKVSDEMISKYAVEALRHQFIAGVRGLFFHKLEATFKARYQQRISYNDYTLLDARVSYQLGKFNIYTDVTNILNTQYSEVGSIPMIGRWVALGVKFQGTF